MKPDVVSTPIVNDQNDEPAITPPDGDGDRSRIREHEPSQNGGEAASQQGDEKRPRGEDSAVRAERWFDRLVDLWKSRNDHDLESRRQMGSILNAKLGSPETRLSRGKQALKKASEEVDISESELSRMRWLAFIFETEDQLASRPEVTSWTVFKRLLPDLKVEKTGKSRRADAKRKPPTLGGVARSIESLAARMAQVETPPAGEARAKLLGQLGDLARAATDRLRILVSVQVE